jgi:4-carboxymuconolactone decarboxylase
VGRDRGITDQQLAELSSFRTSDAFDDVEKLVLDYAESMTKTPVEVSDEMFASLRARFDDAQLVELTAEIAWENWRARFDHALDIGSQGFSEGAACALPERAPTAGHGQR